MQTTPAQPPQPNSDAFLLSKWYADCVTDSGDVFIAYHGTARWRGIALHYSSLIELVGEGPPRPQYSIAPGQPPAFDGATLSWNSKALHFKSTWHSIDCSRAVVVFSSPEGAVEWNCLQPRANAEICCRGNRPLTGSGYSEHVKMTVSPWSIPIQQLHWGRFLSSTDSLVWMDWRGPFSKRVLLHNGVDVEGEIGDDSILFAPNAKLDLLEHSVLRVGSLGSAALAAIPGVKNLFPARILGVQETKWRSRAQLTQGAHISRGWAIHEVVAWPT